MKRGKSLMKTMLARKSNIAEMSEGRMKDDSGCADGGVEKAGMFWSCVKKLERGTRAARLAERR